MIEVLRDKDGNITAVCEWLKFNRDGGLDDNGDTVCICEMEINRDHRGNGVVKHFIKTLCDKNPQATRAFWWRETKYPGRGHKFYSIEHIKRRG